MWCFCTEGKDQASADKFWMLPWGHKAFFVCSFIMSSLGHANVAPEERLFNITALFWKSPCLIIHDRWLLQPCAAFLRTVGWKEIPWRSARQKKSSVPELSHSEVFMAFQFGKVVMKPGYGYKWCLSFARLKFLTVTWMYVGNEAPELGWWAGQFPYCRSLSEVY